jgi:hypothetical protein
MNGVLVATGADERGDGGDGMTMTLRGRRARARRPCGDRVIGKGITGAPVPPAVLLGGGRPSPYPSVCTAGPPGLRNFCQDP